jgi:hypothetical protein
MTMVVWEVPTVPLYAGRYFDEDGNERTEYAEAENRRALLSIMEGRNWHSATRLAVRPLTEATDRDWAEISHLMQFVAGNG